MDPDERLLIEQLVTEREDTERDRASHQEQVLAAHVLIARGAGQRDVIAALTGRSPAGAALGEEA